MGGDEAGEETHQGAMGTDFRAVCPSHTSLFFAWSVSIQLSVPSPSVMVLEGNPPRPRTGSHILIQKPAPLQHGRTWTISLILMLFILDLSSSLDISFMLV